MPVNAHNRRYILAVTLIAGLAMAAVILTATRPAGTVDALGGWQYDQACGRIWTNNPGNCFGHGVLSHDD